MFTNIDNLIIKVNSQPKENFYYEGIKENSLNLLVAPSKIGKTTWAENLAMCIAAGHNQFLGKPVWCGMNQKVLMISLEEFYTGRTSRNIGQLQYLDKLVGRSDWHANFLVSDTQIPRYVESEANWQQLKSEIAKEAPAFTVIDSLSRLHGRGSVEDSSVCIELMRNLRSIVEGTKTTLLVIHHTHKIENEPLSLFNMAGSRILAQEADAIIGMNKTPLGVRYIKPLAYRYADDACDKVQKFTRNGSGWLEDAGQVVEAAILREFDKRIDNSNPEDVYKVIMERTGGDSSQIIKTEVLFDVLVKTGRMSNPTLHESLKKLINGNKLEKPGKGQYKLKAHGM